MGSSRPIPKILVEAIGLPIPRQLAPKFFCGGNDFLKRAAGITIVPSEIAKTLQPYHQSLVTQSEQGAQ
jgi:hypothetical protein